MNEIPSQEQIIDTLSDTETQAEHSQEYGRLREVIDSGRGKINSQILKEAYEQKLISKDELGELALILLEKIEPHMEKADIDELTQLYNLRFLNQKLNESISDLSYNEEERRNQPVKSLMLVALDMNSLKTLNDTYGHRIGDQGLIALADRLRGAVKNTDTIARVGGDEFLISIPIESDEADIQQTIFTRIKKSLKGLSIDFTDDNGQPISKLIEVAAGYAVFDKNSAFTSVEDFRHSADLAMYKNKAELKENNHS